MRKMLMSVCMISLVLVLSACGKKDANDVDTTERKNSVKDREDNIVSCKDKEEYAEMGDDYATEEFQSESDDVEDIDEDNADEKPERKHFDVLPEVVNASFNDGIMQVGDLFVDFNRSEEDGYILSAMENSELGFSCEKTLDKNDNLVIISEENAFSVQIKEDIILYIRINIKGIQDILNLNPDSIYLAHGFQVYGDNTMEELFTLLQQDGINEYPKEGLSRGEANSLEREGYYKIENEGSYQKVYISTCNGEKYTVVFDSDGKNATLEYQKDKGKDWYDPGHRDSFYKGFPLEK